MSRLHLHMDGFQRKLKLNTLTPYITCNICKGYLIEATAITECLHTFCKSCIIKHLDGNTTCPTCSIVIHHSYPRQYLNFDRTMQDIIYKLVPGLETSEIQREKDFYRSRGKPYPKLVINTAEEQNSPTIDDNTNTISSDSKNQVDGNIETKPECISEELISVCLEYSDNNKNSHLRSKIFIRVPTRTTVWFVKRFLLVRNLIDCDINQIGIWCNEKRLESCDTLKFVFLNYWKLDQTPFTIHYTTMLQ